jgi:Tripartite tricarboxylate transporter TctB family
MNSKLLTADRIGGLIWFVFGVAVVYGSWMMDRLESMNIPPATAPGLVPGLQGLGFIAFAIILLSRSRPRIATASFAAEGDAPAVAAADEGFDWRRILVSWVLCALYGAVLLGGGLPYWPLTAGFLFLHLMLLDETGQVPARPTLRRFITAAILAGAVSTIVTMVFRYIFLVRLP